MKIVLGFLAFLLVAAAIATADDFTISGLVFINKTGDLYIHLVDEEQFAIPFTGIEEINIE